MDACAEKLVYFPVRTALHSDKAANIDPWGVRGDTIAPLQEARLFIPHRYRDQRVYDPTLGRSAAQTGSPWVTPGAGPGAGKMHGQAGPGQPIGRLVGWWFRSYGNSHEHGGSTLAAHWPPIGRPLAATLAATLAAYVLPGICASGWKKKKI